MIIKFLNNKKTKILYSVVTPQLETHGHFSVFNFSFYNGIKRHYKLGNTVSVSENKTISTVSTKQINYHAA